MNRPIISRRPPAPPSRPVVMQSSRPIPKPPFRLVLQGERKEDGTEAAKDWLARNAAGSVSEAVKFLQTALCRAYIDTNIDLYVTKFQLLPNWPRWPDKTPLSEWIISRWGNWDWAREFMQFLSGETSHTGKARYFSYTPPLPGGINPELSTCPLYG